MTLEHLIRICAAYAALGSSVQDQMRDLGTGDNNANAVDMIEGRIMPLLPDNMAAELAELIDLERTEAAKM
jgi:hypothetical protein